MTRVNDLARAFGLLAALSGFVGCTDPCLAVCEEARGCPDGDPEIDCDAACSKELEEAPDCEEALEDYYACEATQVDVCEPLVELCAAERSTAEACLAAAK